MAVSPSPSLRKLIRSGHAAGRSINVHGQVQESNSAGLDKVSNEDAHYLDAMSSIGLDMGAGIALDAMDDLPTAETQKSRESSSAGNAVAVQPVISPPVFEEREVDIPLTHSSRSQRFGGGSFSVLEKTLPLTQPEPVKATTGRPWTGHIPTNTAADVTAKQSMAAAKVLTPLVAAISFEPKSSSTPAERSKALASMLVAVHKASVDTAEAVSETLRADVPAWMVTGLMQSMSAVIAQRWQKTGLVDPSVLASSMGSILRDQSDAMRAVILDASDDIYREVTSVDVARNRIAISAVNAAWLIRDWVTNDCLAVNELGEMPSHFYSYDTDIDVIVNRILIQCIDEARALVVQVDSADLRTAHLQASIARFANLVGAEYVTQTRAIMSWIGEPNITDEEYVSRRHGASAQLETRVLPHVFEWARSNFLRIERGAFKAIEDLNEKHPIKNRNDSNTGRSR